MKWMNILRVQNKKYILSYRFWSIIDGAQPTTEFKLVIIWIFKNSNLKLQKVENWNLKLQIGIPEVLFIFFCLTNGS